MSTPGKSSTEHGLNWRGAPLVAASSALFAAMATLARSASGDLSAAQLVTGRFVIGIVVSAAIFASRGRGPVIRRPWLWAQRGLLGGGAVYFYFLAIERLPVGIATLLNYTAPVYASLFAWLFLGEAAGWRLFVGLVVATAGSATVALSGWNAALPFSLTSGVWAGIVSAIFSGAAMATIRALRHDTDAVTIFFSFSLFGLLWGIPAAITSWRPLSGHALLILLGVALLAAAAQLVMTYAFKYVSASAGSLWTQLTPVGAWLLGMWLLGERHSTQASIGACVCIAGILYGGGVFQRKSWRLGPPPRGS